MASDNEAAGEMPEDEVRLEDVLLEGRAVPRSVRELPSLVRHSFRLVWDASRRRFSLLIGLQLLSALISGLIVYLGKNALEAL
ncbi:MAG: hypothetical protein QOG49_1032, partial [Frankiaceae bacterium]|nr:hypothetical protein [Frankiaceae bacterium]